MSYQTLFPIFPTSFFWKFQAVNIKEFNSRIDSIEPGNSGEFVWGENCDSQKKIQDPSEWIDIISPNLEKLAYEIGTEFRCHLTECWVNFYEKNNFQEIHSHPSQDLVAVYFPQEQKEGFSKFYFNDRFDCGVTYSLGSILKLQNVFYPGINAGDILFFPSALQHGVSPHKHDEIRKTFSANFVLEPKPL